MKTNYSNSTTTIKLDGVCFRVLALTLLILAAPLMTGCEEKPTLNQEIDYLAKPISEKKFWETIDSIDPLRFDDQMDRRWELRDALKDWSDEDLKGFKLQYVEQINRLYRHDIYAVFTTLMHAESPEAFLSYRDELVSRGSRRFNAVLEDPQEILMDIKGTVLTAESLSFYLAVDDIKRERSKIKGDEFFLDLKFLDQLQGDPISHLDEDEMKKRYPKVFEFLELKAKVENDRQLLN